MRKSNKNCVLVTGSAGFIGSFLTEYLLNAGFSVIGIDNLFRGKMENISDCLKNSSFKFYNMDLSDTLCVDDLSKIINDNEVETIFHFAAVNGTKYFYDRPLFVLDQNIKITQTVLQSAQSQCVSNFIYASSSEVYGDTKVIPTDEQQLISLNAFAERDSYSSSKAIGEFYSTNFCKQNNIQCLILRIFNVYGPRMVNSDYGQVIPEFIRRILNKEDFTIIGDGEQTRSFCYVKDLVEIILQLYNNKTKGIINVGNRGEFTINELANIIHVLFGIEFRPKYVAARKYDHIRREPDLRKLFSEISFFEYTTIKNGLINTIEYYKNKNSKNILN